MTKYDPAVFHSMMQANNNRAAVVAELQKHANEWEALAEEQDTLDGEAARYRAQTYRRTAQAFRLEIRTGVPHCTCCLKPLAKAHRKALSVLQEKTLPYPPA